ncbi:GTP 3',8-cyclase MoaA [Ralstonia solanacearum]|uniref:GTP 3',8-cyclase n=1 Tax=Ralstonia solanacearum TaxID=305 RepID=A0AAD0SAI8_RALSL|nr:GTP 3',8-cyclase MoaA [Ralstonia solanacearum]AXV82390.1 GTP 3',8-cyclase MoaA [Ralstonia solanacearum]AXW53514.1 GTP 3',8-cyclase MoaA [Ralstonia solanacearum]
MLMLANPTLTDTFGRTVRYLRLSVTDRCNLRCVYCMSEDMTFHARPDLLSMEDFDRIARAFIRRGVRKLRITGGEPLVRKDVLDLFRSLSGCLRDGSLDELTLTTNGTRLAHHADALAAAGVRRVNVSLDTLDAQRFKQLTRGGSLQQVLDGLDAAQAEGLAVKLNAVAMRGVTEHEIHDLIGFAHGRGMALTLIETMPLGDTGVDRMDQFLRLDTLRNAIETRWTLTDLPQHNSTRTGGPARYARVVETGGTLGFITPLTQHFCDDCNRVRVTATGMLYTCLGHENGVDLKAALHAPDSDAKLGTAIAQAIAHKPEGHDFSIGPRSMPIALVRHMSATGG